MIRDKVLRFGPWAVPLLVLLAGLATENRVMTAPAAAPPSRFRTLLDEVRPRVPLMSVKDLAARAERGGRATRVVDVREDAEWAAGHIPGATHLSKGLVERDIEKLVADPAAEIVLYCESGGRSLLAAENLRRMGYTNVFSLDGGYRAWLAAQTKPVP